MPKKKYIVSLTSSEKDFLAGLKQKLSPNEPQTCFISYEYVTIMIEPFDKTIRTSDKSPFGKHDSEETSESVSSRYGCTKSL